MWLKPIATLLRHALRLFVLASPLLCGFASPSRADFMWTFKVRLLSAKNGQPLPKRQIQLVIYWTVRVPDKSSPQMLSSTKETDSDGIATFLLSIDPPRDSKLLISGPPIPCSPTVYDANEVLRFGVAVKGRCPHRPMKKLMVPAQPGEIIFFSGEYSRLEQTFYFPWPG